MSTKSIVEKGITPLERFESLGFEFYVFIVQGLREQTMRTNRNYNVNPKDLEDNVRAYHRSLLSSQQQTLVSFHDLCTIIQIDCSVATRLDYYWGTQ
jgi:hypothetical protein